MDNNYQRVVISPDEDSFFQRVVIAGHEDENGNFKPGLPGGVGGSEPLYTADKPNIVFKSFLASELLAKANVDMSNVEGSDISDKLLLASNFGANYLNNTSFVFNKTANAFELKEVTTTTSLLSDLTGKSVRNAKSLNNKTLAFNSKTGKFDFVDRAVAPSDTDKKIIQSEVKKEVTTAVGNKVNTLTKSIQSQDLQIGETNKKVDQNTKAIAGMKEKIFGLDDITIDDKSINPTPSSPKDELSTFIINITRQLFLNANNKTPKNFEMPITPDYPNLKTVITNAMKQMNPKFTGTAEAIYIMYNPYIQTKSDGKLYSKSGLIMLAGSNFEVQTLNFNIDQDTLNVELVHSGSKGGVNVNGTQVTTTNGNLQSDLDTLFNKTQTLQTEKASKNDLSNKLNTDLGNVDNQGFKEKLDDNKVAYKSDIPTISPEGDTTITISDEYGESENTNHIQLDRGLRINKGSHNTFYEDEPEDDISYSSQTEEPLNKVTKIGIEKSLLKSLAGNDGFYASLENPTELTQAKSKSEPTISKVFIDYTILDTLGGVQIDKETKTYGIQELDMLDPNISGGESYVVAAKLSLKGYATEDFTFKAQFNNMLTNLPVTDSNGSVYEVVKNYKKGDKLGEHIIYGITVAKGIQQNYIQTTHDNTSDGIILNDKEYGNTSIGFQELTESNKTGKYINQFMFDNNIKFKWNHQYLGESMFNLKYLMPEDYNPVAVNAGNMSNDGVTVFTNGMIKHSVKNKMMTIESDGQIASFGLGKIFDVESSKELGNSNVNVKTTLADPTNAVRIGLMQYNGNHLEKDNKIITGFNNGTPIMDNGWKILDSIQINENPRNTVNAYAHTFGIPMNNANNYAIFVYTADAQDPNKITIQDFEISSELNKNVWTISAPDTIAQMKYRYSDDKLVLDEICPTRFASLRYTINSKPTVMPVGVIKSGNAMLKPVKIWSDSGYEGEGGLEALTDMNLTIDYQTFINTLLIGEKAKGNQTIRFYVAKNQVDWKNPIVGQPDMTNVLNFDPTKKDVDLNFSATISLKKGDQIACYMSTNVDDGAYLKATTGKRLYEVTLTAEEVVKK